MHTLREFWDEIDKLEIAPFKGVVGDPGDGLSRT